MHRCLGLVLGVLLVLLCSAKDIQAQGVPVYDNANYIQNFITAVEAVLTTIQAYLIEANQILELTGLDDIGVSSGIAEDMRLLALLVTQAEGLSYDISSLEAQIQSLFGLDAAPDTLDGLKERVAEIKRIKFLAYSYAARVQTLLKTAARTAEHLVQLLDTLSAVLGNKQSHQTHSQISTTSAKHLANIDVNLAAFQRAETIDKLAEALIIEALTKIEQRRIDDWPSF